MTNRIVMAAAGSGKTEHLIRNALELPNKRILITTYTYRNAEQLADRIWERSGTMPAAIRVATWFEFLLRDGIKPYQVAVTDPCRIRSINFESEKPRFAKRKDIERYYLDGQSNVYGDLVSDLACVINEEAAGKTIRRLESCYDAVFIDELQDLVGYDLDFIELLLRSNLLVMAVGDPRQFTYATNRSQKNKKYRGMGLYDWVEKESQNGVVAAESMNWSYRCNQYICDFADRLYPACPRTESRNDDVTGHDGVFLVHTDDMDAYVDRFEPTALRWDKRSRTANASGLAVSNIGMVKGCTFTRVLIFPTDPMLAYLRESTLEGSASVAKLYVAVTRARSSVAFVVDSRDFQSVLADMWSPSS